MLQFTQKCMQQERRKENGKEMDRFNRENCNCDGRFHGDRRSDCGGFEKLRVIRDELSACEASICSSEKRY